MINAFSEGLVLADKSGLNPQTLLDVLDLGGIANPMFRGKGPTMIQNSYTTTFPLKHQQKDMRLALAIGDENAVSMPVAAAANEAFKRARSAGLYEMVKVAERWSSSAPGLGLEEYGKQSSLVIAKRKTFQVNLATSCLNTRTWRFPVVPHLLECERYVKKEP